jgi:ABC transporter C-terminal domain
MSTNGHHGFDSPLGRVFWRLDVSNQLPGLQGRGEGGGVTVAGQVTRGKTVRLGYLAQDGEGLDPRLTPRDAVTQIKGNALTVEGPGSASTLLERFGLRGDTLQRLERQLDRVTARHAELSAELAASASDYTRLIELGAQLREVESQKADLEDRWLTVAEDLSG